MAKNTNSSELIEILLDICSQGCIISGIGCTLGYFDGWSERLLKSDIEEVFPKQMVPVVPDVLPFFIHSSIYIKGIGENHEIEIDWRYVPDKHIECYISNIYFSDFSGSPDFSIHSHLSFFDYYDIINKVIHHLYTKKFSLKQPDGYILKSELESPSTSQTDNYKKILWNYMYDKCFGTMGPLYLLICNKYLVQDIKKIIINNILITEKWSNLGFYCR